MGDLLATSIPQISHRAYCVQNCKQVFKYRDEDYLLILVSQFMMVELRK